MRRSLIIAATLVACAEPPRLDNPPPTTDTDGTTSPMSTTTVGMTTVPEPESTSTGEDPDTTTGGPDPMTSSTTGSSTGTTGPGLGELLYLEILPQDTILELDLDTPGSVDLTANAWYEYDTIEVTDEVTWDVENPIVGAMNGATFEIPAQATSFVESTLITGTFAGVDGQAQVTVAAYAQSGPSPDFFFVLPYNDPGGSQEKDLTFSTDVKQLDVFFNLDTTVSMNDEIANLQSALNTVVVPGISAAVDDAQYGVGAFEDFPVSPYGESNCTYGALGGPDQPFELFAEITDDTTDIQAALDALAFGGSAIGCGADTPESTLESLYQIATGDGLNGPGSTFVASNVTGIGGVGFREGSLPVIVNVTDAYSHDPAGGICFAEGYTDAGVLAVAHDTDETIQALGDICARVITVATIAGPFCSAQADGMEWNEATGAFVPPEAWDVAGHPVGCASGDCCTGIAGAGQFPNAFGMCPLTYLASGTGDGVDASVVAGIEMLARYAQFDVTRSWSGVDTDVDGGPLPLGTTTADFIVDVVPSSHGLLPIPGVPNPTLTETTFEGVIPATDVTFTVEAFNDFIPQTGEPQVFIATIQVLADDCGSLDEREVFILVPPAELPDPG